MSERLHMKDEVWIKEWPENASVASRQYRMVYPQRQKVSGEWRADCTDVCRLLFSDAESDQGNKGDDLS